MRRWSGEGRSSPTPTSPLAHRLPASHRPHQDGKPKPRDTPCVAVDGMADVLKAALGRRENMGFVTAWPSEVPFLPQALVFSAVQWGSWQCLPPRMVLESQGCDVEPRPQTSRYYSGGG